MTYLRVRLQQIVKDAMIITTVVIGGGIVIVIVVIAIIAVSAIHNNEKVEEKVEKRLGFINVIKQYGQPPFSELRTGVLLPQL